MAIELTTASLSTIDSIRDSLSAADSKAFLTQDTYSTTNPSVICDPVLKQVKMGTPLSDTQSYYESSDYTSAEWSNQGGAGTVVFIGSAPYFNNFLDNILGWADEASLRVEFNENGTQLTVDGWGFSGSDASVTTTTYPESPTAITSIRFYYTFINRVELNNDSGNYGMYVFQNTLNLKSTSDVTIEAGDDLRMYANDILSLRNRGDDSVTVYTNYGNNNEKFWEFNNNGTTSIPSHLTFTYNNDPSRSGSIQSHPLSSGDGNGYTTLELHPDLSRSSSDQYLIIDPTQPNHIHIRAGGAQDNSSAQLILGGENSYFAVPPGQDPSLYIVANNNSWEFASNGYLNFPDGGSFKYKGTAPGSSIGTEGDVAGMFASSTTHFYYCTGNYASHTSSITIDSGGAWGGIAGGLTSIPFSSPSRVPEIGWVISGPQNDPPGSATLTLTSVTPLGENRYDLGFDNTNLNVSNGFVWTLTDNIPQENIWKRIAWSNDTW